MFGKFVNRTKDGVTVRTNRPVAHMKALDVRDAVRFLSLFDADPSTCAYAGSDDGGR